MLTPTLPLLDCRTTKEKKDIPDETVPTKKFQGVYDIKRNVGLKTVSGPYQSAYIMLEGVILPAKKGIRYFIHSYSMGGRSAAANTCEGWTLSYLLDGADCPGAVLNCLPAGLQPVNGQGVIDVLTDENSYVSFNFLTAAATKAYCALAYCEVPT